MAVEVKTLSYYYLPLTVNERPAHLIGKEKILQLTGQKNDPVQRVYSLNTLCGLLIFARPEKEKTLKAHKVTKFYKVTEVHYRNKARKKHSIHLRLYRSASTLLNAIRSIHSVQVTPRRPFKKSAQIDLWAKRQAAETGRGVRRFSRCVHEIGGRTFPRRDRRCLPTCKEAEKTEEEKRS